MANIMTIVADDAFAATLRDGLLGLKKHIVSHAKTEDEIAQILADRTIDLAIVDVDLEDAEPVVLVQAMRALQPALRVMWMPFLGSTLSEELLAVEAQGILTKPFFMEELPAKIDAALGQTSPTPAGGESESRAPLGGADAGASPDALQEARTGAVPGTLPGRGPIDDIVNQLALELDAEVVIVFDAQGTVHARAGNMSKDSAAELAGILQRETATANEAAAFLKERGGHFWSSTHEGDTLRVFSATVSSARIALAAVTRADIPIGTVRYRVRQAAARLADAIQGME